MPAVHRASEDDAEAVAGLLAEFADLDDEGRPDDVALCAGVTRLIRDGEAEFFLAEDPPAGVAQVRYRWNLFTLTEDAYLEDLFVREPARRRGLGRALVEAALARAGERGAARMELYTSEDGAPAIAFYEALGFENRFERPGARALFYARWVSEPPRWRAGRPPL